MLVNQLKRWYARIRYTPELLIAVLMVVLILVVYHDVSHYFFTGRDAISFVAEGRITSWAAIPAFFTRRQFAGSSFPAAFYRPITSLSFALDYALWGLNPLGYHLTDLVVHWAVAVLTYLTGRTLLRLTRWGAFLAAAAFVIYPTHEGTIPVIARRIDPVAAVFTFAAVLFFAHSSAGRGRWLSRVAGWMVYGLALLSKETAVVALPVMLVWVLLQEDQNNRRLSWLRGLALIAPFVLLTIGYLLARTCVLGGLGGYADKQPLQFDLARYQLLSGRYVMLLFSPLLLWLKSDAALVAASLVSLALATAVACLAHRLAGRSLVFLALGLTAIVAQLILLLAAQTLTTQHAYAPLAWLCLLFARLGQDTWTLIRNSGAGRLARAVVGWAGVVWVLALAVALVTAAPPLRTPTAWRDVGESQRSFLALLDESLGRLPAGTRVAVVNLPFLSPPNAWDRQVAYLSWLGDYAIRDWLALRFPDRRWDLELRFNTVRCTPLSFSFEELRPTPGFVQWHVRYDGGRSEPSCPAPKSR